MRRKYGFAQQPFAQFWRYRASTERVSSPYFIPSPLHLPEKMASSVDAKLLKRTKFPPEFNKKVDMSKVNVEVLKTWIASEISKILGNEDDVVIELCFAHLEGQRYPDIKSLQIQLTGFLDKDTPKFCQKLWSLCLSGQDNPQGVPKELLEAKKLELMQEKLDAEKATEAIQRQREQDQNRERDLDNVRRRERSDRARGGRGGDRGGRFGGRDFDRPPRDHDRSRDRFREPAPRRDFDSYVPRGGQRGRRLSTSSSHGQSQAPNQSSPPRQRRDDPRHRPRGRRARSPSDAISPEQRNRGGYGRRSSPDYGDRVKSRSISRSRSPRSRSPRGDRRRQSSVSPARGSSPSRSRRSFGRYGRDRDFGRLSPSPDYTLGVRDREENRRPRSPSGGRSRSRSPKRENEGKRRGSMASPNPDEKRQKMADDSEVNKAQQAKPPVNTRNPKSKVIAKAVRARIEAIRREAGKLVTASKPKPKQK
ncbi:hypothetical protein N7457_005822 [Penicillium paradoxum]|uniref:uncharacterized protein n=1 Tax=Penicillium paradoxum TaxID=176176 RepID=UPI0025490D03|nr:uncharacterized protein N7457_005822 [Penicillium paradoxum]KAJ5780662.1 hypothetical protein N7457_005822 [Penicillium paradoxum]